MPSISSECGMKCAGCFRTYCYLQSVALFANHLAVGLPLRFRAYDLVDLGSMFGGAGRSKTNALIS